MKRTSPYKEQTTQPITRSRERRSIVKIRLYELQLPTGNIFVYFPILSTRKLADAKKYVKKTFSFFNKNSSYKQL